MTMEEFRILHSTLIEHYQFIEAHLEGIYAAISSKYFVNGLKDVEKHSIHRTIVEIKKLEAENGRKVLTEEEYLQLQQILQKRNFWCHNCYYDMVFSDKTGGLKYERDIKLMKQDLWEAEVWRERLFDKKCDLFKQ